MKLEEIACDDECPVRRAAEIIEGKWTTLIVRELLSGKKRYSEIQRALGGISPKMLSARLRLLEEKALVNRAVFDTIPPTTEYTLTELGLNLEHVLQSMAEFGNILIQQGTEAKTLQE
jgi:DNA-binding HxlR family transcriptional regulator